MEKRGQQRIYRLNPDAMLEMEVWMQVTTQSVFLSVADRDGMLESGV
jgi:hypothetical protein